MSERKWIIFAAVGIGLLLMGVVMVFSLVVGLMAGHKETAAVGSVLPIYTSEQSGSMHAGYRHSTLTCGSDVFVNDYEEACLQLADPEPQIVIGHCSSIGDVRVCAISGEPVTAYIAGDCGSEMPAYAPYRNIKQKPFDWRSAKFRELSAYRPRQSSPFLTTTKEALLAEVVANLRDGDPVELPSFPFASITDLGCIKMTSDQLPGLLFCPCIFTDAKGQTYLAESLMLDNKSTPLKLHARWVPASPTLLQWLNVP